MQLLTNDTNGQCCTCKSLNYSCPLIYRSQVGMTIWLQHFDCSNSSTVCLKDCYRAPTIKNIYCSNKAEVFLVCSELSVLVFYFLFHMFATFIFTFLSSL